MSGNNNNYTLSLKFSPDEKYIAVFWLINQKKPLNNVISDDKQTNKNKKKDERIIKIYKKSKNSENFEMIASFKPEKKLFHLILYDLSWSPDSKSIIFTYNYNVCVITINDNNKNKISISHKYTRLNLGEDLIFSAAWSPKTKKHIICGFQFGGIKLYNSVFALFYESSNPNGSNSLKLIKSPREIAWSNDGKYIAVGGHTHRNMKLGTNYRYLIRIFDLTRKQFVYTLERSNSENFIQSISWNKDNNKIVAGYGDNKILIWDLRDISRLNSISSSSTFLSRLLSPFTSPHKKIMEHIKVTNLLNNLLNASFAFWHPKYNLIISYLYEGTEISVIDGDSGKTISTINVEYPIMKISINPNGDKIIVGNNNAQILLYKFSDNADIIFDSVVCTEDDVV
jgi:WD40 repeat protein